MSDVILSLSRRPHGRGKSSVVSQRKIIDVIGTECVNATATIFYITSGKEGTA